MSWETIFAVLGKRYGGITLRDEHALTSVALVGARGFVGKTLPPESDERAETEYVGTVLSVSHGEEATLTLATGGQGECTFKISESFRRWILWRFAETGDPVSIRVDARGQVSDFRPILKGELN